MQFRRRNLAKSMHDPDSRRERHASRPGQRSGTNVSSPTGRSTVGVPNSCSLTYTIHIIERQMILLQLSWLAAREGDKTNTRWFPQALILFLTYILLLFERRIPMVAGQIPRISTFPDWNGNPPIKSKRAQTASKNCSRLTFL
jgi:hypothetical protein